MKKGNARRSKKFPSKRSLQRALKRTPDPIKVSWKFVPHMKNETLRTSIVRRAEAVLRSWGGNWRHARAMAKITEFSKLYGLR